MQRRFLILIPLAALAVAPATAGAKSGFKLPMQSSVHGNVVNTSVGWHCGKSMFGTYRFKNGLQRGNRRGYVIFKVKLAGNGSAHRPTFQRFGGRLSSRDKRAVLHVLNHTRHRYVGGTSPLVQSDWENGSMQATRPFNPERTGRAHC